MVFEMIGIYISLPLYVVGTLVLGATFTASVFIFHVAVVPLVFKYSKTFRHSLVFANFVQWPLHIDYENPSKSGIEGARNFNLQFQSKVDNCEIKLGVWHILPKSVYERFKGSFEAATDQEQINELMSQQLANSKTPVILYCHGNSNSRATSHRILLYKFFQKMEFHTIAFDYRGYGDSTNVYPSEAGVVEDSLVVYKWLLAAARTGTSSQETPSPHIFIWGHSLGTGISCSLLGQIVEELPLPRGLILEAPFANMADEVRNHPLSKMVTWLPYYESTFIAPFRAHPEYTFRSDQHLAKINQLPVLILHAKDDVVVPFITGRTLYKAVVRSRSEGDAPCVLHAFDKSENLGHKYICLAKDLQQVVGNFVSSLQRRQ